MPHEMNYDEYHSTAWHRTMIPVPAPLKHVDMTFWPRMTSIKSGVSRLAEDLCDTPKQVEFFMWLLDAKELFEGLFLLTKDNMMDIRSLISHECYSIVYDVVGDGNTREAHFSNSGQLIAPATYKTDSPETMFNRNLYDQRRLIRNVLTYPPSGPMCVLMTFPQLRSMLLEIFRRSNKIHRKSHITFFGLGVEAVLLYETNKLHELCFVKDDEIAYEYVRRKSLKRKRDN